MERSVSKESLTLQGQGNKITSFTNIYWRPKEQKEKRKSRRWKTKADWVKGLRLHPQSHKLLLRKPTQTHLISVQPQGHFQDYFLALFLPLPWLLLSILHLGSA